MANEVASARLKFARFSAYKAREVLDIIRGENAHDAISMLLKTSRGPAIPIAKVLASAIANAAQSEGLDATELYVSTCFADEGATMKRFKPRARGRASRIRKRNCHITIEVSRLTPEELEKVRSRRAAETAIRRQKRVEAARASSKAKSENSDDVQELSADTNEIVELEESLGAEGQRSEAAEKLAIDLEDELELEDSDLGRHQETPVRSEAAEKLAIDLEDELELEDSDLGRHQETPVRSEAAEKLAIDLEDESVLESDSGAEDSEVQDSDGSEG